jgi:O-antigen/teichoic acid export membrane protein
MFKVLRRLPPTVWVTAEKIFGQLFWLGVFAVQAPLLGPYAFGLVTMVMVFVGFWEAVPGIAATSALISIQNIDHLHFSTVTTTCALFCLGFGAIVFGFAEPLAAALGDTELAPIMRAMAVLPLIQAFSIAPIAAAERDLRFQSIALRTIASLLVGGVVGLALTLIGAGVWALVWQALVQRLVAVIVLWVAVPIPFRLGISWHHFRELAGFALPGMIARAMGWAQGQIPRLILGLYLGPTELGLFSLATRLNDIVSQVAVGPKALVARVDLRRFATNPEGLGKAVRRVFLHISVLSFPLCVGGAAVAPTLFHAWLDPRWYGAIIPSQLMLLMGVPFATFFVATSLLLALNRQNWEAGISTAQCLSIVIAVAAAAPFGLVATTAAIAAMLLATLPLPLLVIHRQCGLSLRDTLLPQTPAFVAACVMGVAVFFLRVRLDATVTSTTALSILIAAGATLYVILIASMTPEPRAKAFKYLTDVILAKLTASLRIRK